MPYTRLDRNRGTTDILGSGISHYVGEKNSAAADADALGTLTSYGLWEHMLRTNPIIALGYLGLSATMQSVEWVVDNRKARALKRVVRFVDEALNDRMDRRLKDVTRSMWHCVPLGVAPHEATFYVADGHTWLRDLQYRPIRSFIQHTIYRGDDGFIRGTQQFYRGGTGGTGGMGGYGTAQYGGPGDWPSKGMLWWPTYGEGILGTPLLRPIVNEHFNKEEIRRGFGVSVQKVLCPVPVVHEREGADGEGTMVDGDMKSILEEVGDVINEEQTALGVPWTVEKIQSLFEGQDSRVITRAIEAEHHADTQVLLLFGAPYMARGLMSGTGTNAAAKVDATEQRNFRRFYLDLGTSWLQWIVDKLVDINFGPQRFYPEVRAVYHQEMDPLNDARTWASYRSTGALSVSDADEDHIREENSWPSRQPGADPRQVKSAAPETPGSRDNDTGDDDRARQSEEDEDEDR